MKPCMRALIINVVQARAVDLIKVKQNHARIQKMHTIFLSRIIVFILRVIFPHMCATPGRHERVVELAIWQIFTLVMELSVALKKSFCLVFIVTPM